MASSASEDEVEYAGVAGPSPIKRHKMGKVSIIM